MFAQRWRHFFVRKVEVFNAFQNLNQKSTISKHFWLNHCFDESQHIRNLKVHLAKEWCEALFLFPRLLLLGASLRDFGDCQKGVIVFFIFLFENFWILSNPFLVGSEMEKFFSESSKSQYQFGIRFWALIADVCSALTSFFCPKSWGF